MSEDRFGWPNPVKAPNYQEIYSNVSQTIMTPWDISLRLGFLRPSSTGEQHSVQELALVTFSPQQFKALAAVFAGAVSAYEAQFGPVTVSAQLVQSPESIRQALDESARPGLASTGSVPPS